MGPTVVPYGGAMSRTLRRSTLGAGLDMVAAGLIGVPAAQGSCVGPTLTSAVEDGVLVIEGEYFGTDPRSPETSSCGPSMK